MRLLSHLLIKSCFNHYVTLSKDKVAFNQQMLVILWKIKMANYSKSPLTMYFVLCHPFSPINYSQKISVRNSQ